MSTIHSSAVVETDSVGTEVTVGEFSVVRPGAVLGDGVTIHPHVVIDENVEIGAGTEVLPHTYLGRRPKAVGGIVRDPTFREVLRIGEGCSIGTGVVIYYDVEVGSNTLVGDASSIREISRIGKGCVIGRSVVIGRDVQMDDDSVIMYASHLVSMTRVGKNVFIGAGVMTANDNAMGAEGWTDGTPAGQTIEDEARIASSSILLPGVTIGRRAIVGAGALVTRDVEPGVRVLGIPARPA